MLDVHSVPEMNETLQPTVLEGQPPNSRMSEVVHVSGESFSYWYRYLLKLNRVVFWCLVRVRGCKPQISLRWSAVEYQWQRRNKAKVVQKYHRPDHIQARGRAVAERRQSGGRAAPTYKLAPERLQHTSAELSRTNHVPLRLDHIGLISRLSLASVCSRLGNVSRRVAVSR